MRQGARATVRAASSARRTDYTAVAAAVNTLAIHSPISPLATVTISAGNQHPAEIHTSRRLPYPRRDGVWTALNADQSIPHADVFTINGAVTGPLSSPREAPAARPRTPRVTAGRTAPAASPDLPPPVLYTAPTSTRGTSASTGQATGPVIVTVGGCMTRGITGRHRPNRR